jgi:predicted rRNA methylase YqxC with S4 and FtsJ domains
MTTKQFKKTYEVARDGRIRIYPALFVSKGKGKLRHFLKKIACVKEGIRPL